MFDAYESDLMFLRLGDKLDFEVQALPGAHFSGKIAFIDPVVDPVNRVSKVRLEVANSTGKLKPEMFATGTVQANLSQYADKLIIPSSAVLWTGKRSVVYVKQANASETAFKMREVELGPNLGYSYVVMSGLSEGEEIVTQGTFSVDAAAQLDGKPSMMNIVDNQEVTNASMHQPEEFKPELKKQDVLIKEVKFNVSGVCDMCKERIENAALSVDGVKKADWSIETHFLDLKYDASKVKLSTVQQAIAKAGHDNGKFKADDKTYNSLPECCWYRK
jgi:Cu(I)/Ag(I) efflux system membrane fusion protein